jgi:hypothetical protein
VWRVVRQYESAVTPVTPFGPPGRRGSTDWEKEALPFTWRRGKGVMR